MKNTWLYHINPKSPEGYEYGWNINDPKTMLKTKDREWPASQMRKQVSVGDILCVYLKNMKTKPDGVYIVGRITKVDPDEGTFIWRPDRPWSAQLVVAPISKETVREFFGRGFGGAMQRLPVKKTNQWMTLFSEAAVGRAGTNGKAHESDALPSSTAGGGGLGTTPEQIKKVELAAVQAVTHYYESEGWSVKDVSKENLGYDLVSRRKKAELHVEVKGSSGSTIQFPITQNELERWKTDDTFVLAFVGKALGNAPAIQIFSGSVGLKQFYLRPLSYVAVLEEKVAAPTRSPTRTSQPSAPTPKSKRPDSIMSRAEAEDLFGENWREELRALNAAIRSKPPSSVPPIPTFSDEALVPPECLELRKVGDGWCHYLDGQPLRPGNRIEMLDSRVWISGTFDWSGDPLERPALRDFITDGPFRSMNMVSPLSADTRLRRSV